MSFKTIAAVALLGLSTLLQAQDYPARPITMVVTAPAGGAADVIARTLADEMSKSLKQPIVIDNKAGASGMLGVQAVARAKPDGYTVLLAHAAPIFYAPLMFSKVPYDVKNDLAPITEVTAISLVYVVHPSVPAKDLQSFIAWARNNKGKVSYGSFGIGSPSHLANAYFDKQNNLNMAHAVYKGEAPLVQDLVGGQVAAGITTLGTISPYVADGRLRVLAVLGAARLSSLPNVPTMAQAGFKDPEYVAVSGHSLLAPAGTPAPVLARLEQEALAAMQSPGFKARLQIFNAEAAGKGSADFRRNLDARTPMIKGLITAAGVPIE